MHESMNLLAFKKILTEVIRINGIFFLLITT